MAISTIKMSLLNKSTLKTLLSKSMVSCYTAFVFTTETSKVIRMKIFFYKCHQNKTLSTGIQTIFASSNILDNLYTCFVLHQSSLWVLPYSLHVVSGGVLFLTRSCWTCVFLLLHSSFSLQVVSVAVLVSPLHVLSISVLLYAVHLQAQLVISCKARFEFLVSVFFFSHKNGMRLALLFFHFLIFLIAIILNTTYLSNPHLNLLIIISILTMLSGFIIYIKYHSKNGQALHLYLI